MRLQLRVRDKFYYDVGLRLGNETLSKTHIRFGENQPRFLEDFIERYGKDNIKVLNYGSLINKATYIDDLLR